MPFLVRWPARIKSGTKSQAMALNIDFAPTFLERQRTRGRSRHGWAVSRGARTGARKNVEFRQGDAYGSDLPAGSFDRVHMRFVASTAGDPERLLREAIRLVRPGGVVALQEPDGSSLNCHPPHPAWERLKAALLGAFSGVGADLQLAKRLYAIVRQTGLEDVQYRPFVIGVRSGDPMADYLPSTVESLRATVVARGYWETA